MSFGLNLLPRAAKQVVGLEAVYERWRAGLITLMVVLATLTLGLFGVQWMLERHDQALQRELQSVQTQINQKGAVDISRLTTDVNEKISLLNGALPISRQWASLIRPILAEIPADITIENLEITADGKVTLKGTAKTRAAFLNLQAAMNDSKALNHPTTTDTASKRDNLPFMYTATLPTTS